MLCLYIYYDQYGNQKTFHVLHREVIHKLISCDLEGLEELKRR